MTRLLLVLLLLTPGMGAASAGHDAPLLTPDEVAAWREDLAALVEGIERIHPNPYWRTPQPEFSAQIAEIDAGLPQMTRTQAILAFARLVNSIDGHTSFDVTQSGADFKMAPLKVYDFDDGLYVVGAEPEHDALVGQRIVEIGRHPIEDVWSQVLEYAPYDNAYSRRWHGSVWVLFGELLHGLGLIEEASRIPFTFEASDGTRTTLEIETVTPSRYWDMVAFGGWGGLPKRDVPLSMSRRDEAFWFAPLEDADALYIQYNAVRSSTSGSVNIRTFANDIRAAVEQHDDERVILDMRHNPGGDNTTFGPLLTVMQEIGASRPGRLIVITSRRTFSAAANFATELEKTDSVIFVGEPMGGSPNLYGDTRPVRLPNSGLTALISSRYWERSTPDDTRDTITPDVIVPALAADWFAGRDPLLDEALAWP
jgi:hypothetical protein